MKFYSEVLQEGLTHSGATIMLQLKEEDRPFEAITRAEWDGFHFYNKEGEYAILFKNGHVETNMESSCWNKEYDDWMLVVPTEEALNILKQNNYI